MAFEQDFYRWPGCVDDGAHEFTEMNNFDKAGKAYKPNDIVAWAWCKRCGSTLEVYAGQNSQPIITRPQSFKPAQRT